MIPINELIGSTNAVRVSSPPISSDQGLVTRRQDRPGPSLTVRKVTKNYLLGRDLQNRRSSRRINPSQEVFIFAQL